MKAAKKAYHGEKVSFRDYLKALSGISLPWLFLALTFAATIVSTLATMDIATITGSIVDADGNVPTTELVSYAGNYLLIGISAALVLVLGAIASEKINLGLRTRLWKKIIYTRQCCYDQDGGESLVSRVTTDCDFASKFLTTVVSMVGIAVGMGIYIARMLKINEKLTAAMLLLIPVSVLIGWIYAKLKFIIAQKSQAMLARTTAYLVERTKSLPLIKTANAQAEEIENGRENFDEQYKMQIKTGLMNVFYTGLQTVYTVLTILIPFFIGGKLVSEGVLKVGHVVAFYTIAGAVGTSATNLINSVGTIRQANGALSRVLTALKLPDEEKTTGRAMDDPDQDIVIEEVEFSYGEKPILKKISCVIPKNKVTAVVGSNGSGKSTFFKLLDRLYDPAEGSMKFGDTDVKDYDLHAWRKAFCMVAQGSPLMEGTLRENICYGCERPISDDELIKVAKQSRAYDFIEKLPEGFDTRVAPGGANFSGGQRQLIAIARAMMNNPDYLLLDEATSNLDAKNERLVMDALEELMAGRTTVIIAHSLSTIRKADHVVVIRNGQVESTGAPSQILNKAGNYLSKVMSRKSGANA
ncbi:MAG: ABC transporter ATP-binding protein [Oscillospiraceae bacterium]|nr:ABC transporter ATP-binding protein [Oscillospiraceae bacterium]